MVSQITTEKVTFNIPSDLKADVIKLKDELKVSLNSIYKQAIADYVEKQEIKKWERGASMASNDKEYITLTKEWSNVGLEVLSYD